MDPGDRLGPADLVIALVVLVAAIALSLQPHLANAARAGDRVYLGLSENPTDQAVYLAWVEQARRGALVLGNMFDAHPAPAKLPNLTFLVIGRLAALTGTPAREAYVAARFGALVLLAGALLALAAALTRSAAARRLALVWMLLGGGGGAAFVLAQAGRDAPDALEQVRARVWVPADVALPEFTPAGAAANFAHLLTGMALMALSLALLVHARTQRSVPRALAAGGAALLAGYAHIYALIVLLAVAAALLARAAWRGDRPLARALAAYLAVAAVPFAHYVALFATDPYLRSWARVPLPSPAPSAYAAGLGAALLLAIPGLWRMRRAAVTADDELVCAWMLVQGALLYSAPLFDFERRMCEGWFFAFVIVSASEVAHRLSGCGAAARAVALAALGALVLPTGPLVQGLASHREPSHRFYFRAADELAATERVGRETPADAVILADPAASLYLPGLAGRRVAVGHVDHTRDYRVMVQAVVRFLAGQMPRPEALAFLEYTGATHFFSVTLDVVPPPLGPDVLAPVFVQGRYGLFRVKR